MKNVTTRIEIILSQDEEEKLFSRDIILDGEKVFHDEFKKRLVNTNDFLFDFIDKLLNGFENE